MKYMGSKRVMLQNGLGHMICNESKNSKRIVDLFTGTGSIAWFAAQNTGLPVLAVDLQQYAVLLAGAVIHRNKAVNETDISEKWLSIVRYKRKRSDLFHEATVLENKHKRAQDLVPLARVLCSAPTSKELIWSAYGGHYFSPRQAYTFDLMMRFLPENPAERQVCLATLIMAASQCAAAPGHTAQPFQPTDTAARYIIEAWRKDPIAVTKRFMGEICPLFAKTVGKTQVADAVELVTTLKRDDLVVIDPPYSDVQYSRFYHVIETIARGTCSDIQGRGRYPPIEDRPQSDFSKKGQSAKAIKLLITELAKVQATAIFTFPLNEASNGLSGEGISALAKEYFHVTEKVVEGKFSTMGGNNTGRAARHTSKELILLMKPR